MKKLITGLSAIALAFALSPASANDEFISACEEYAEDNDSDIDCECLNEAATENPSLYEEFAKVESPEDAVNMSEEAQSVAAQCSGA